MLCFHAQYKECLSLTWNADLSFFLITLTCSYISTRAIAQHSRARLSPGFSETDNSQESHQWHEVSPEPALHCIGITCLIICDCKCFYQHTLSLFWKENNGIGSVLLVWDAEDLHQFQAQSLSHFLHWWRGLGHCLWMNRLFSRMNKCLCDDRDLHRGFSQVGQSMTAAESWFSTQSSLERWACRSNGPQNHPQVHYLPVLFVRGDFLQKINIKLIMKQTALNGVSVYRTTITFQYFTVISSWQGPDSDKIEKIVLPRLGAIKIETKYKEKEGLRQFSKNLLTKKWERSQHSFKDDLMYNKRYNVHESLRFARETILRSLKT